MTRLPDYFLRAITDKPDDDAPRLAAADWWEENGEEERGELIRLQCGPAKVVASEPHCPRVQTLLVRHWMHWFPIPFKMGGHIERGFPWKVECTAADWLAHGDTILAQHPVTEVTLTTMPEMTEWRRENVPLEYPAAVEVNFRRRWPRVRKWHLPPVRWNGAFERSLLVNQPEFAGVEYWHPSETTARAIVHPVSETPPAMFYVVDESVRFGSCRVDLQVYVVNGYRLRAGRCSHGRAFFTRAERYHPEPGESEAAFAAGFASH